MTSLSVPIPPPAPPCRVGKGRTVPLCMRPKAPSVGRPVRVPPLPPRAVTSHLDLFQFLYFCCPVKSFFCHCCNILINGPRI